MKSVWECRLWYPRFGRCYPMAHSLWNFPVDRIIDDNEDGIQSKYSWVVKVLEPRTPQTTLESCYTTRRRDAAQKFVRRCWALFHSRPSQVPLPLPALYIISHQRPGSRCLFSWYQRWCGRWASLRRSCDFLRQEVSTW